MADYINPNSIRPDYAWKPSGFLAGMNYDADRARYENVAGLQDYMMKNQAVESGAKLEDYFKDAPVREAKRGADIATAEATKGTIGDLKSEEVRGKRLGNDLAQGELQPKISKAIAEAAIKGGEASMQELQRGAMIAGALSKAAGAGPGALASVMQQLHQSGADPKIISWFANSKSPAEIAQKAQILTESFAQASREYQQAMAVAREHTRGTLGAASIHAEAQVKAAEIRSKEKNKSAEQILQSIAGKDPENQLPFLYSIIQDADVDVALKVKAQSMYEQAKVIVEARRKNRGEPQLPGLPTAPNPNLDPRQTGTNTGIPGVERVR